jgi:hypothetical protein
VISEQTVFAKDKFTLSTQLPLIRYRDIAKRSSQSFGIGQVLVIFHHATIKNVQTDATQAVGKVSINLSVD